MRVEYRAVADILRNAEEVSKSEGLKRGDALRGVTYVPTDTDFPLLEQLLEGFDIGYSLEEYEEADVELVRIVFDIVVA